jgi:hypothetical protein
VRNARHCLLATALLLVGAWGHPMNPADAKDLEGVLLPLQKQVAEFHRWIRPIESKGEMTLDLQDFRFDGCAIVWRETSITLDRNRVVFRHDSREARFHLNAVESVTLKSYEGNWDIRVRAKNKVFSEFFLMWPDGGGNTPHTESTDVVVFEAKDLQSAQRISQALTQAVTFCRQK